MKKRRILFLTAAVALITVLVIIGVTRALYTEVEVKDNLITIGNIKITLDEGTFDPEETHPVVPGSKEPKAPKLINSGTRDEFVFLKIIVPKADVTLLNEDGSSKGTPKDGLNDVPQQIFRLTAAVAEPDNTLQVPSVSGRDIDFSYHSNTAAGNTVEGWVLLESDTSGEENDVYAFGYNKKLAPNQQTLTLFDTVQLKSFIDAQTTGSVTVDVLGFGIQADNLKPDGSEFDVNKTYFSFEELNQVYTIVKNKSGV